jgi:hypothetical protein
MGRFATRRLTRVAATVAATLVLALNLVLLLQVAGIPVPFLAAS